jgi:hypothetical protein
VELLCFLLEGKLGGDLERGWLFWWTQMVGRHGRISERVRPSIRAHRDESVPNEIDGHEGGNGHI